jgi:hypothetical protein
MLNLLNGFSVKNVILPDYQRNFPCVNNVDSFCLILYY